MVRVDRVFSPTYSNCVGFLPWGLLQVQLLWSSVFPGFTGAATGVGSPTGDGIASSPSATWEAWTSDGVATSGSCGVRCDC